MRSSPPVPAPVPAAAAAARPVDLVAFDVDGTLVENRHGRVVWQILLERFGADPAVSAARHASFEAGEIDYPRWVELDVRDWIAGGATRPTIEAAVREELALAPGAREVVGELARRGYHLAVVSGTLDVVLDVLFPDHPFCAVYTNRLRFAPDGQIAGWQATPYDMDGKARGLRAVAESTGTPLERTAFVGDHLNDLSAFALAGLPIAYDPKHDRVRAAARLVLPAGELRRLLALLP